MKGFEGERDVSVGKRRAPPRPFYLHGFTDGQDVCWWLGSVLRRRDSDSGLPGYSIPTMDLTGYTSTSLSILSIHAEFLEW